MITRKRIEMHGQVVEVRPLTWGELKKLQAEKPSDEGPAVMKVVCPELNLDEITVPLLHAAVREVWALTTGTEEQRGNLSSTGVGTPPSGASTAMPAAENNAPASV
ncbi:MAG: hypothetical protein LLG20_01910 [Acidobacteriales bacterium]|nr:hypothetical protein [Terriglobales bacterium]